MTDMMHIFEMLQPTSLDEAVALLDKHGKDGWVIAGGKDSLDWFKDRVKKPEYLIAIRYSGFLTRSLNQSRLSLPPAITHPSFPCLSNSATASSSDVGWSISNMCIISVIVTLLTGS